MTGQISPEDIQWMLEDPGVSHRGNHAVSGSGMNRPMKRENVSGGGKGRGALKNQSKKEHRPFQNGLGKKGPDIQIRNTGTLLKEVGESRLLSVTCNSKLMNFSLCNSFSCDLDRWRRSLALVVLILLRWKKQRKY